MRAWEIPAFGLEALRLNERPEPEPGAGQVRVRMRAASLNYRDLLVVTGQYNPRLRLPMVPCSDGAGEVTALGPGVTRFRVGDRVAGTFFQDWPEGELTEERARTALGGGIDGVMAESRIFAEAGLVRLPDSLSDVEGATLPCAAVTAWNALVEAGRVRAGETILVQGTGGVSLFALQFARLSGARVIVTSSSEEKLQRARELGAWQGINYREVPEWDRAARELTGGSGVDHVIEVGGAGTLARSLRAVRMGGRISLIGVLTGNAGEVNPVPVLMKSLAVQGIFVGSRAMFERMNAAIAQHDLHPVIDRVFPWTELPEALTYLQSGRHLGKVCLRF